MELEPSDGRTDVRRQHLDEFYADRGITLDNFEQVGAAYADVVQGTR